MDLSPPTTVVFVVSVILAALAIVGHFVAIPFSARAASGWRYRLCRAGGQQRRPGAVSDIRGPGRVPSEGFTLSCKPVSPAEGSPS
jgi:hypothetical protein